MKVTFVVKYANLTKLYQQKSFGWMWCCQKPCCKGYAHSPTIPTFQCYCPWCHLVTKGRHKSCPLSKTRNKTLWETPWKYNKSHNQMSFFNTLNNESQNYRRRRFKMFWLTLKPFSKNIIASCFTSSMISLHFSQLSHSTWSAN